MEEVYQALQNKRNHNQEKLCDIRFLNRNIKDPECNLEEEILASFYDTIQEARGYGMSIDNFGDTKDKIVLHPGYFGYNFDYYWGKGDWGSRCCWDSSENSETIIEANNKLVNAGKILSELYEVWFVYPSGNGKGYLSTRAIRMIDYKDVKNEDILSAIGHTDYDYVLFIFGIDLKSDKMLNKIKVQRSIIQKIKDKIQKQKERLLHEENVLEKAIFDKYYNKMKNGIIGIITTEDNYKYFHTKSEIKNIIEISFTDGKLSYTYLDDVLNRKIRFYLDDIFYKTEDEFINALYLYKEKRGEKLDTIKMSMII